ncbi:MFS transporter [Paenibacillus anaericanus]|uniref:MFS transporter n=1 Tax=Paenibacillus anaericanus TaxID=170367 RepID=A0A3S1DT33_9BACL|nr:MFS transporter [Paenibacillus anaericanus]RUT46689.1 MFS transporter [Paenibacillus anaericanus]
MKTTRQNALIFSFTFMAFILGTTEYIIVGLLSEISASLGVTLATAGGLVSGFAISYAIGTPLMMSLCSRVPKRITILVTLVLILLLNLWSAVSGSYSMLLVTRIVTAVLCGFVLSVAITIASEVVDPDKRGKGIATILSGFAIANVLGVPIGTLVGQFFTWPAAFVLNGILAGIAIVLNYMYIPRGLPKPVPSSLKDQVELLTNGRIILAFFIPVMAVGAVFVMYTYITPLLEQVMNIPKSSVSGVLLVYGIATIVSNWLGGKIASGNAVSKLRFVFLIQTVVYIVFSMTASIPILGMVVLMVLATMSSIVSAPAQLYLIDLAKQFAPRTKDLAASLNPVASNVGIAGGSAVGGVVVQHGGLTSLPIAAAIMAIGACSIAVICSRLDHPGQTTANVQHHTNG